MARFCPICKLAFRAHDGGYAIQFGGDYPQWVALNAPNGSYTICQDCYMQRFPEVPPLRIPKPRFNDGISQYYCAVCKNYSREDDPMMGDANGVVGIAPEDMVNLDEHPELKKMIELAHENPNVEPRNTDAEIDALFNQNLPFVEITRLINEIMDDAHHEARKTKTLKRLMLNGKSRPTDKDIGDYLEKAIGFRHGIIRMCFPCREKWCPKVWRRWIRSKAVPPNTPYEQILYNFNLT